MVLVMQIGLLPGLSVGMGGGGTGCFQAAAGLTRVGGCLPIVVSKTACLLSICVGGWASSHKNT